MILLLALTACGGGEFIPLPGPLNGTFTIEMQDIGTMVLTTGGGLLGGTGTLVHNAQSVTVTIQAVIDGTTITGTVSNASLGGGTFTGQFVDTGACRGSFSYTDIGNISTSAGTWEARIPTD